MINNQELLYVVDEFDTPQKPQPRKKVFKDGLWRRTVHVWILNNKNQILCQKRSMKKDISPGMWESYAGGHVGHEDENYFIGAARELSEETGLSVLPKDLDLVKIYKADKFKEYRGIFTFKWDGNIDDLKSEEDEVDEVKFININKVKKYLQEKDSNWCLPGYEEDIFSHIDNLN
ncbi:MAG TPA: NUDIX domain-containing protein [Patescibacteria group bacterium]|nr:NUDIX domain-containing protein [Patescibacteria group bacterium]